MAGNKKNCFRQKGNFVDVEIYHDDSRTEIRVYYLIEYIYSPADLKLDPSIVQELLEAVEDFLDQFQIQIELTPIKLPYPDCIIEGECTELVILNGPESQRLGKIFNLRKLMKNLLRFLSKEHDYEMSLLSEH